MILPQSSSSACKDISGKSIAPSEVLNLTPQQQDTVANFDKISFLSDQVNRISAKDSLKLSRLTWDIYIPGLKSLTLFCFRKQVLSHLPFLTSFLETQMFTVFVDRTVEHLVSSSADNQQPTIVLNSFEAPFEIRLKTIKEAYGESLVRTPTYKECQVHTNQEIILLNLQNLFMNHINNVA